MPNISGLSAIICTYRRPKLLAQVLASLMKMKKPAGLDLEVLVLDNANDAETAEVVQGVAAPWVRRIVEPRVGASNARNTGIRNARYDHVALLDDDVKLDGDWLHHVARALRTHKPAFLVPRILVPIDDARPRWLQTRLASGVGQYDLGIKKRFIGQQDKVPISAAVIFRKGLFNRFGPFPENLDRRGRVTLGAGDTWFFRRIMNAGFSGLYEPEAVVWHQLTAEKTSKKYWWGQAFHGGRSYVLMRRALGEPLRFSEVLVSTLKASAHLTLSLLPIPSRSDRRYKGIAHTGRACQYWWRPPISADDSTPSSGAG